MAGIERLLEIMARLRDPERGCPWDREQTFATIVPFTIEEAYEVADAIARGDMGELRDELGDLLFQVVFYARMAEEAGDFDFADVVEAIVAKLTRRHPHVFGDARVDNAEQQSVEWERHKAAERAANKQGAAPSVLDGVSLALPALSRAVKLQRRAARVGFDWRALTEVLDKVAEELEEVHAEVAAGADQARMRHEIGDLLLACSNLARFADIDPESALREANQRFERRFRRIEAWLSEQGKHPEQSSLAEMEALWQRAKREETHSP
jgi:ATP diphosphatase